LQTRSNINFTTQNLVLDYSPFGQVMPNRHAEDNSYKYGFNGKEKDDELKGGGNSYDFGARMLDVRIGRFLSCDAKAGKFPSISPFVAYVNNPICFVDVDGNEPNVAQATTIENFVQYLRENKLTTSEEIYQHLKANSTTVPRYIYTEGKGWIDMNHVFCVVEMGYTATNSLEPLSGNGTVRENFLGEGAANSYYSYEDLPSNKVGDQVKNKIEEKESKLPRENGIVPELKGEELYSVVLTEIGTYGAIDPKEAPNYTQIPAEKDRDVIIKDGQVQELSPAQLRTGKYVPQNHTAEPYNLKNFPMAPSSIMAKQLKTYKAPEKLNTNNKTSKTQDKSQKLFDKSFKLK